MEVGIVCCVVSLPHAAGVSIINWLSLSLTEAAPLMFDDVRFAFKQRLKLQRFK